MSSRELLPKLRCLGLTRLGKRQGFFSAEELWGTLFDAWRLKRGPDSLDRKHRDITQDNNQHMDAEYVSLKLMFDRT
jgi:hypothetical protein